MSIPDNIIIKNGELPPRPGVYEMRDAAGKLLYIGKATSLKSRVSSYFVRPADARIARMVTRIGRIDHTETPTAAEALFLESRLIKKFQPPYNVMEKDDRSDIHLAFTREAYPRPVLIRGHELVRIPKRQFLKVFGPFGSVYSVQAALDALRPAFPWTTCRPGRHRPCFYRHLGRCPGVCTGEIEPADYRKIIVQLLRFFGGGRRAVERDLKRQMKAAAKAHDFESAARLRDRLKALNKVRDLTVIKSETRSISDASIDIFGRIEAYDISNIGGQDAVGSMAVFVDGRPRRSQYRKFRIAGVAGPDDPAMIGEVIARRLRHLPGAGVRDVWPRPDLLLIDGGPTQLAAARRAMRESGVEIPLVGMAKGPDRKRDELIYDKNDHELARLALAFKPMLQRLRDEAHRFAVGYHRQRRKKTFINGGKRR